MIIYNEKKIRFVRECLFRRGVLVGEFRFKQHDEAERLGKKVPPLAPFKINLRVPSNGGLLTPEDVDLMGELMSDYAIDAGLEFDVVSPLPKAAEPPCERFIHYQNLQREAQELPARRLIKLRKSGEGINRCIDGIEEGAYAPGETALLFDDLITKSLSKLEGIKVLEANGLKVRDALVLLDREEGGREELARLGYRLHAVFKLQEVLDLGIELGEVAPELREKYLAYRAATL
jgi:orotate phosphoribosyltransferase